MNEDLQNCIEKLKVYAERAVFNKDDLEKLEERITQLQVTRESILEYEKKGVPVPEGVRAEEAKLLVAINKLTGGSEFGEVYKALLPIAVRLGRVCQRPLQKDLRETIIKDNKDITPPRVFRDLVIQFLKDSGGSASLSDVIHQIEQSLQGQFTGADRDLLPGKKRCRSQDNVLREIRQMKRERILTRRGGSTLILASHDRELSEGKQLPLEPPLNGVWIVQFENKKCQLSCQRFSYALMHLQNGRWNELNRGTKDEKKMRRILNQVKVLQKAPRRNRDEWHEDKH